MNAPRPTAESSHYLTSEPGNGTRYEIHVMRHRHGGWIWIWMPETTLAAAGWASDRKGGEVRGKLSKADRKAISDMLDQVRS